MDIIKNRQTCCVIGAVFLAVCPAGVKTVHAETTSASDTIDRLVYDKLDELGIPRSDVCTDEVFLRRVYLDSIGTLPQVNEVRSFLDHGARNRSKLIEELLQRDEFADYRAMRWCDLLRVKAEFPSNLWPNAVQAYHRWIRTALLENMRYDQFARDLLTSNGSNFRTAPVNFYRAVPKRDAEAIAEVVALTFMGMRTEGWSEQKRFGMAAFFGKIGYKKTAEWKEEIVFFDPAKVFSNPSDQKPVPPVLPDGIAVVIGDDLDPRQVFTDWLIESDYFAQCMVNRIWYWLLGRGIVHEPDDFRPGNPPQNKALLDFLADELKASGYDVKHIYRIILNSKTYQLSAIHNEGNRLDQSNFSHYSVRRLDAEVLIDAICQITKTTESYSSSIPEPFTWIPEEQRSIALADGSITSPFLDLYGRPPRDSGYESERNNTPSNAQKLHLLNSSHIQKKILKNVQLLGMSWSGNRAGNNQKKTGKSNKAKAGFRSPEEVVEIMYLSILSRYPTEEETAIAVRYIKESGLGRRDAAVDLVWALLNTKEFIFRH